jgi:hypothetical protein
MHLCAFLLSTLYAQEFTISQLAHQPLTNESIVTLAKAGFDELFILDLIHHSRTNFDTSVDGLVALKKTGVSEDLIRMMAMPQATPSASPEKPEASAKVPSKMHRFFFKRSSN